VESHLSKSAKGAAPVGYLEFRGGPPASRRKVNKQMMCSRRRIKELLRVAVEVPSLAGLFQFSSVA
jgi:hypothetical protein